MSLFKAMLQTWRGNNADQGTLRTLQKQRLDTIVHYAREKSPYYKNLYANIGNSYRLEDLPTTSKQEMMSHLDEVFTGLLRPSG